MSRLLADTTPLENRDYRRLWTAGIVTVIGAQLSVVAVPQQVYEITRSSAYVGLTGNLRSGPAGRFRSVGRRTGRRHGSTTAVDDHLDRTRRHVGAVLDPGCPEREQRVVGARIVLGSTGVLRGEPADASGDHPSVDSGQAVTGRELAEHDCRAVRCDSRPATGGCPHTVGRSATAVPARLDLSSRHTVGGMEAPGDSADRNVSASRIERGPRRFHVSRDAEGSARVVRGGHHRDGVRDVASVVPGDRSRILR